jgi:hypothetical protein
VCRSPFDIGCSVALDQMKDFVKCLGQAMRNAFEVWFPAKLNGGEDIDENLFVEFMTLQDQQVSSGVSIDTAPPPPDSSTAKS